MSRRRRKSSADQPMEFHQLKNGVDLDDPGLKLKNIAEMLPAFFPDLDWGGLTKNGR